MKTSRTIVGSALLASLLAVAPPGTTSAAVKQKLSFSVDNCDIPEDEDVEDIEYDYLADETAGSCKVIVTLKPRTPRRGMVLQRWDDEEEKWSDVAKATSTSKGTASLRIPDTFDEDCLAYDTFKFRVFVRKSGANAALTGKSFEVAFLSDEESDPCQAEDSIDNSGSADDNFGAEG